MATNNVLVLGGGLAGVACAQTLVTHGLAVTLVDRNDYHQFQPLLYQVATAQLPAEDIARPHRSIFKDQALVEVITAHVQSAKLADRTLTLSDGRSLSADYLVMAAGARPNFFGVPGAAEHAYPLYSVADAERLRLHLRDLLQRPVGSQQAGSEREQADLSVAVVGAGPTGVETAGAIAELFAALRGREELSGPATVYLLDRGAALLPQFSEGAHGYALDRLTREGVVVMLGVGVAGVEADRVRLSDGSEINAGTVVWAGGESASAVAQSAGPEPGRGGRLDVLADLSVQGYPGVYAAGDVANIPSRSDGALPQLGSVAQQSGRWAAENILRELAGEPTKPFKYKDKGIMAMIGRNAAVAEVGRRHHHVDGPVAFAAWLGVHAMLLSGVHSRTDAFLTWAWDYFDRDHAATLESHSAPKRIAWGEDETDQPHISLERPRATPEPAGNA